MLGWSINPSAWRSASKRAMTERVSMPSFNHFKRDAAADGFLLLGHIDNATTAFADFLEELVPVNRRACGLWNCARRAMQTGIDFVLSSRLV